MRSAVSVLHALAVLAGCAALAAPGAGAATVRHRPFGFARAPGSPLTTGPLTAALASVDLDGDGRLDLAAAGGDGDAARVVALLGGRAAGGGWSASAPLILTGQPLAVATADFDGDGHADVAVPSYAGGAAHVLLGDGSGALRDDGAPVPAGPNAVSVLAADLDRDGDPDLVTGASNGLSVSLNDGRGGFAPAPGSPIATASLPWSVTALDANHDNNTDLAFLDYDTHRLTVLLGDGHGGFRPGRGYPSTLGWAGIAAGDVNGDHRADLVVDGGGRGETGSAVTVLLGDGHGGFRRAAKGDPRAGAGTRSGDYAVGGDVAALALADLDGDHRLDIVVTDGAGADGRTRVLLGDGRGRFTRAPASVPGGNALVAADLDGDHRTDVAISDGGGVEVWLNRAGRRR